MSHDDDYLWDRSGEPDPDVARLERLLAGYRLQATGYLPPNAERRGVPDRRTSPTATHGVPPADGVGRDAAPRRPSPMSSARSASAPYLGPGPSQVPSASRSLSPVAGSLPSPDAGRLQPVARSLIPPWLAAAALLVLSVGVAWVSDFSRIADRGSRIGTGSLQPAARSLENATDQSWRLSRVTGRPTLDAAPVTDRASLTLGRWLETDAGSSVSVAVGRIGRVDVASGTRLRLLNTAPDDHRLELVRGTIEAQIWAPPGRFFVETPSATAVDLGCAYTLTIDQAGVGLLTVSSGWVGFEHEGRESFIPAGASGRTYPGMGPGTPVFDDASGALREAVHLIDTQGSPAAPLQIVLRDARERDGLTLWHLIDRVEPSLAPAVVDRLAALVPMPEGVTRDGVLAGNSEMRDAWWEALGLGSASWWRTWRQRW